MVILSIFITMFNDLYFPLGDQARLTTEECLILVRIPACSD